MKNIILAGFDGKNNPARIVTEKAETGCTKLILPNDKRKSAELLLDAVRRTNAVCVIMLGQKPVIKDKIAVEPTAQRDGDILRTPLDCTITAEKIRESGYNAYISKGCGTSYCNNIYYECLQNGTPCIFLHIPVMKNISDINAITRAVEGYISELGSVPCAYNTVL